MKNAFCIRCGWKIVAGVDVAIAGGGPGGRVAQLFARTPACEPPAGAENFPREKVAVIGFKPGGCNSAPAQLAEHVEIAAQRSNALNSLHRRPKLVVPLPTGDQSEIAIKRSLFDQIDLESGA